MEYGKWEQRFDDRELESTRKRIEYLMKDHPSEKFILAFCGIFSSGKSSLLNELLKLNEKEKLPTGIKPITKVITRIEYGRTFQASYVARGKTVSLCREQAEQIAVGNERLPEECTEIVIKIPSALPGRNMVFLDTPGFQDNAVLDETTRLAVRQADLAVVCCHADHFGNMFEQNYFQDLEDSIGNFCVVVNQMDTVLEEEDVLALRKSVKDTICGRGTDKLRHFTDKTVFYTVGAGKDIDLDGLDSFLIDLRNFEQDRRALHEYADKHRKLYSLKECRKDVGERISAADRAWKEKEKELTEFWNEQKRQHDLTISTIHREAETMSNFFRTRLDGKFTALYARVDRLEEKNHITDFCEKVSAEIKSMAALLAWEMYNQCKNYPALQPYHHPDRYEQALNHIVNDFHVPKPQGRRVKKRGLLGQILESISSSIELEMIWLDDGYEMVYEGYAKDANRCIREHLYRSVIDMTMEYIQSVATDAEPEEPTRDRSELDKIEQNLQEWKVMDNKIQHFQKRLEWQIERDKQRDSNNQ